MNQQGVVRPNVQPHAKRRWPLVIAAALAAFLSGCSATDDRSASWEYISPALFQPNCATVSCHSRAAAVAGLDFSDPDRGYTSLTGLEVSVGAPNGADEPNLRPLVTAFVPAQSRVVNMLRARAAPRMPPDRPLSEADIRLVEAWILSGAKKSASGSGGTDGAARDGGGSDATRDAGGDAATMDSGGADADAGADAPSDSAGTDTRPSDGGGPVDGPATSDSAVDAGPTDASDGSSQ